MSTYTHLPKSFADLSGLVGLYSRHRLRATRELPILVGETQSVIHKMEALLGTAFRNMNVLDVGPGPFLIQSFILGLENNVTAMDLEIIPVGASPVPYVRMLWTNGLFRTMKTLARKGLGIDREYRRQLARMLNVHALPRVNVVQRDVTGTALPGSSFQGIHSRALFQHLSDPERAATELVRLLAPGGVLYVSLHLYTSFNGSLDPRVAQGFADESMHWADLRPSLQGGICSKSYLNKLRLSEWASLFGRVCPGNQTEIVNSAREGIPEIAERLIRAGELEGYTKEELCAHTFNVYWKKPGTP